jgi:hypothetical protein
VLKIASRTLSVVGLVFIPLGAFIVLPRARPEIIRIVHTSFFLIYTKMQILQPKNLDFCHFRLLFACICLLYHKQYNFAKYK